MDGRISLAYGHVLAVDGCYWACPYEIVFYDFSDPSRLPLPELDRCEGVTDPVIGWADNDTFLFTVNYDVRKSDGKKYVELSDAEKDSLDEDTSQIGEVINKLNGNDLMELGRRPALAK